MKRPGIISNGYDHYGVWICGSALRKLGFDQEYPVVIHKTDQGIETIWADFSGDWSYVSFAISIDQAIVRLQVAMVDPTWELISKNCEHFGRFVVEGVAQSSQIQNAATLLGIGVTLYLLSDRENS